jgi:hypothetical protein
MENFPMADDDDLRFKIVRTNSHDESNSADYQTACGLYLNDCIDYRDGALISRSEPEARGKC